MNTWTWTFEAAGGTALTGPDLPRASFPSQADAETWVGENWHDLLDLGVEQVSLMQDGHKVYGPMSLRPVE